MLQNYSCGFFKMMINRIALDSLSRLHWLHQLPKGYNQSLDALLKTRHLYLHILIWSWVPHKVLRNSNFFFSFLNIKTHSFAVSLWDAALLFSFVVDLDQAYFAVTSKGKKCLLMDMRKRFLSHSNFLRFFLAINMDQGFPPFFHISFVFCQVYFCGFQLSKITPTEWPLTQRNYFLGLCITGHRSWTGLQIQTELAQRECKSGMSVTIHFAKHNVVQLNFTVSY